MSPRPIIPFGFKLFLLFVTVPLLEIFTLIALYQMTSLAFTVAVVVLSAVLGVTLMKHQWRQVFGRGRRQGGSAGELLGEAILLLMAGALLVSPGLFTDIVGYCLLVPPIRRAVVRMAGRRFAGNIQAFAGGGGAGAFFQMRSGGAGPASRGRGPIVEQDIEPPPPADGDAPAGSPFADHSPFERRRR